MTLHRIAIGVGMLLAVIVVAVLPSIVRSAGAEPVPPVNLGTNPGVAEAARPGGGRELGPPKPREDDAASGRGIGSRGAGGSDSSETARSPGRPSSRDDGRDSPRRTTPRATPEARGAVPSERVGQRSRSDGADRPSSPGGDDGGDETPGGDDHGGGDDASDDNRDDDGDADDHDDGGQDGGGGGSGGGEDGGEDDSGEED